MKKECIIWEVLKFFPQMVFIKNWILCCRWNDISLKDRLHILMIIFKMVIANVHKAQNILGVLLCTLMNISSFSEGIFHFLSDRKFEAHICYLFAKATQKTREGVRLWLGLWLCGPYSLSGYYTTPKQIICRGTMPIKSWTQKPLQVMITTYV